MITAISPRAAPPALRLMFSVLASLLLHAAVLWPRGAHPLPPPRLKPPPLEVELLAPALATHPDKSPAAQVSEPVSLADPAPPVAVPPAPNFVSAAKSVAKPAPLPVLRGRTLTAAMAALEPHLSYPREAAERGWEGDTIILLTLTPEGRIVDVSVATSSGYALLDEAAVAAVRRIGRLAIPARQALFPVQFRLD
jgi:protein TonB